MVNQSSYLEIAKIAGSRMTILLPAVLKIISSSDLVAKLSEKRDPRECMNSYRTSVVVGAIIEL